MRIPALPCLLVAAMALAPSPQAKTITVTTTNSESPPVGQTSLKQALEQLVDGDTISFNLTGPGPHYLPTPPGGYPYIRANNVLIDGYSQPGAAANTNPILATNNARIMIVLDSRNLNYTPMDYTGQGGSPGYGTSEVSILGLIDVSSVRIRGLAFLGVVNLVDPNTLEALSLYSVSFANSGGAAVQTNQVAGCWFGVDPKDGTTVAPTYYGVTGWGDPPILEGTIIGVAPGASDAEAKASFNVFCGQSIPIIIEGDGTRVSGNFIGVLPDGMHDYNITLDPATYDADHEWEGHIELGDHSTAVIGTDGDGVNDAQERNVLGGGLDDSVVLPEGGKPAGYSRSIEFYSASRDNIVVAGNYIGVAIDGLTRFTNSTTPLDATAGSGRYRFGSDFDGVSDDLEGNVVGNHWPPSLVTAEYLASRLPDNLRGFSDLQLTGSITYRGNTLINNSPFPVSPTRVDSGDPADPTASWLTNYYVGRSGIGRVFADASQGIRPILSSSSSASALVGTAPLPLAPYVTTELDLYLADPEGMQTGKDVGTAGGVPDFPHGFLQGKVYLESFVVDGPGDLDPAPGAFRFSLDGVDLKGGQNLTVAATYSETPAGTHNAFGVTSPFSDPISVQSAIPVQVTASVSGGNVTLTWTGGVGPYAVEKATSLTGPTISWSEVASAVTGNSVTLPATGDQGFYRVRSN